MFTAADSYDRFMGRYSVSLAHEFADFASIEGDQRVLDVGCGPGALVAELVRRIGEDNVSAVDPSGPFVETARERNPGVDIRVAAAEALPFEQGQFDAALAQLVVHFMSDPVAGLGEMRRVVRNTGTVAACVWDHAGGKGPLATFWEAARQIDPEVHDESERAGTREGHLGELFEAAGLTDVDSGFIEVRVEHPSFDEWWSPFTLGVGPAGSFVAGLSGGEQSELSDRCRSLLPSAPFVVTARAWAARGHA